MGYPIGLQSFDTTRTDITAQFEPGTILYGTDGFYQYVKAEGASSAGGFVLIDELNDAYPLNTTNSGSLPQAVGVAEVAVADESFFWVWRGCGNHTALVTNGATAGQLTTTGSDGIAGTGGDTIIGARNTATGVTATRVAIFAATLMATNT